jgi:hypothetical protein
MRYISQRVKILAGTYVSHVVVFEVLCIGLRPYVSVNIRLLVPLILVVMVTLLFVFLISVIRKTCSLTFVIKNCSMKWQVLDFQCFLLPKPKRGTN